MRQRSAQEQIREYPNGCRRRWQMFRLANEYGIAALFSLNFREHVRCLLLLRLADLRLPCKHHHRLFFPKHCNFMLRSASAIKPRAFQREAVRRQNESHAFFIAENIPKVLFGTTGSATANGFASGITATTAMTTSTTSSTTTTTTTTATT